MKIDVDTISENCVLCPMLEITSEDLYTESFNGGKVLIHRSFYCENIAKCKIIEGSIRGEKIERI